MKLDRFIRVAIAIVVVLGFVVAIGALLFITESALNVWDRLREGPRLLLYAYFSAMVLFAMAAVWLIWRLVAKRKVVAAEVAAPLSRTGIKDRLREAEAAGVDVSAAQAELKELAARQESGAVHLWFFGAVSSGKSSLITD